ncbi:MAG TPA: tetratricopeptide repeat protein [Streptosporangiaceae bacterium]|nr:tetratricopeptide repeat protein [Streptosporangiaceae bacterium]
MEFRLLGPVEVFAGGGLVDAGPARQRCVLAALAADAGRVVPVEVLQDRVWGGEPPPQARRALYVYVTRLRRLMESASPGQGEGGRLVRRSGGYVLDVDPDWVDLHRFRRLVAQSRDRKSLPGRRTALLGEAVGLWRGDALGDLAGQWPDRARQGWQQEYIDAVGAWAQAALGSGEPGLAVGPVTELAGRYPLNESLAATLMQVLTAAGRSADALSHYARTRTRLTEQLGADPGTELQAIHQAILRGQLAAPRTEPGQAHSGPATPQQPPHPSPAPPPTNTPNQQILASDPALAVVSGNCPVDAPVVPHELPPDTPHFVGRVRQLSQLTALREPAAGAGGVAVVCAIDGMSGVGKSALAIRAAHQLVDAGHFPDGQLYINLQGATPGLDPVNPLDALGRMIRALGVRTAQVPAGLDEGAAMFRTLTVGRRMLMVLDNARDATQVRPLIPASPGCRVLVTSRQVLTTLDLDAAQSLHLDAMPAEEALELLDRLAGSSCVRADPEAAAEVVRCCGYLPLAIRIAGARLSARPNWPVRELADRLAATDATQRLEELTAGELGVQASFDVSLHALQYSPDPADQAAAHAFGLLSLPDGPDLDVMASAALLDRPERTARALLERLADAQLVQTPQPGRYRFHDLLRLHARQSANSRDAEAGSEGSASLARLFGYYTATAWHTAAVLRPGDYRLETADKRWTGGGRAFPDASAALRWLETERANLLAAITQAAATPDVPSELAFQLTSALYGFFLAQGYWADGVSTNQVTLDLARRLGDRAAQAYCHNDLGTLSGWLGRYQEAFRHNQEALALARALGDQHGQARSLNNLGTDCWRLGRYEDAIARYQESIALARELNNTRLEAGGLGNLAVVFEAVGRDSEALGCHRESVALFQHLGDSRAEAGSLNNLGRAYEERGHYQDALVCQRVSLRLFRDLGDRPGQALTLNNLGRAHEKLGHYQTSLVCQRVSLRLCRELGERHGQAEALRDLGDALLQLGRVRQARQAWQEALKIFRSLRVPEAEELSNRLAGQTLLKNS